MVKRILLLCLVSCSLFSKHQYMLKDRSSKNLEQLYCQRWNWMSICDFAYGNDFDGGENPFRNTTPFDPNDVLPGNVIFVTGHGMRDFFEEVHPHIKNPYILVSIFGGFEHKSYLDDSKIIAWFGNDNYMQHPKFVMIPLGLMRDISLHYNSKGMHQFFLQLRSKPKTRLLYMNFLLHDWSDERRKVYELFKDKPFVTVCGLCNNARKSFPDYMSEMADFKFVLSPVGDMFDCYRHWEAIMVGAIPIVRRTTIDPLFDDLPVVIVDDWNEVSEEFLNAKYAEMSQKKYNLKKLYLKYWMRKINERKAAWLRSQRNKGLLNKM